MRVLLVTSWDTACGIAEHAKYLKAAIEAADPTIRIVPSDEALDPAVVDGILPENWPDLIHLNYHLGLHSRWTPEVIRRIAYGTPTRRVPLLVTLHDTSLPIGEQARQVYEAADVTVVHEPPGVHELERAVYIRQGVQGPVGAYHFGLQAWTPASDICFKGYPEQPVLGTVGFPFPWKNYDLLAAATARAGWALVLLAPGASPEQIATWTRLNPQVLVVPDFIPADTVVAYLGGCDATAFLYTCANTGTSGAIRQGIAARKPVIAAAGCRQFRDLHLDTLGRSAIRWIAPTEDALVTALSQVPIQRVDAGMVALAAQESWTWVGQRYAGIYRELVDRVGHDATEQEQG